eukprot:GHRQ01032718.1.p1 GENE.GHRQ01032718.1~~GHRQ01032718.1.p1  ORF type:complete len:134 (+),score=7.27 GHRQ01032718.1:160-561(+)
MISFAVAISGSSNRRFSARLLPAWLAVHVVCRVQHASRAAGALWQPPHRIARFTGVAHSCGLGRSPARTCVSARPSRPASTVVYCINSSKAHTAPSPSYASASCHVLCCYALRLLPSPPPAGRPDRLLHQLLV